jgi:nucleolar protein 4
MRLDAVTSRDPFLTVRATRVTVHPALSRTESQEVTSAVKKKKKSTKVAADDPRNLYLLLEGHILPDSLAAKGLPPKYVEMLQHDYEKRKMQLRNINLFVSKTRLSVRNLPRKLSENDVRRLFLEAARRHLEDHPEDLDRARWTKHGPIRNIKLLKDSAGQSKGYAFVEFFNHPTALAVLRYTNNNPSLFGDRQRLIVSFAVEDINAIQKLMRIKELKAQKRGRSEEDHEHS